MGSEWKERVLSDLISVKHGWAFKGSFFDETENEGPIVVAIGNFDYSGGFRFSSTKIKRYTSDYPIDYELVPGEILLAMTCQTAGGEILGIPGRIPADGNTYLHNQRLGKVVVESEDVDDGYLYWLFLSRGFNYHLYCTATGTKILHTAPERILKYKFSLPPLPEQRAIAHILGSLDDKIELNRRMNATLEGMAQALFRSWFVDFDPVIDQALAAGEPIPEPLRHRAETRRALGDRRKPLPAAIQQQFPSRFVFNEELGWVPEGWEDGRFEDIAIHIKDNVKADNVADYDFYVGLEHIGRKQIFLSENGTGESIESNKSKFEENDLLFGKLRPYFHKVCLAPCDGICSTDILVFRANHKLSHSYMTMTAYTDSFVEYANMRSTGTRMPRASAKDMLEYPILIPLNSILSSFESMIGPMWEKGMEAVETGRELAKIRDTLLPKLLSGQLRIPEAEKLTEGAL